MTEGMAGHTKHGWVAGWPSRLLELGRKARGDAGCRQRWGLPSPAEPVVLPAPRRQTRWPGKGEGAPACLLPLEGLWHPVASHHSAAERCLQPQAGTARGGQYLQPLQPQQLPQPPAASLHACSSSLHPIRIIAAN